jgi:opacity protein-like surface antigen
MKMLFRRFGFAGLFWLLLSVFASSACAVTAEEAFQVGLADYKQGLYDQCIVEEKAALVLDPNDWQAYQVLGYAYFVEGHVAAALEAYHQSLQINPSNPQLKAAVDKEEKNASALPPPPTDDTPNHPPQTNGSQTVTPTPETKLHSSVYFNLAESSPYSPSDFSQNWVTGPSFGAGFGFDLTKQTSIVLSFQYSNFPLSLQEPGETVSGGAFHSAMVLLNGKFTLVNVDNPVLLYIVGGIGGAEFSCDSLFVTDNATGQVYIVTATALSEIDFAFRLGLGIDIRVGPGVYVTLESNGVDTFVSPAVSTEGPMFNNLLGVGMRFDN